VGPGNGASSIAGLRDEIERYRKASIRTQQDPDIGCLLRDVRRVRQSALILTSQQVTWHPWRSGGLARFREARAMR